MLYLMVVALSAKASSDVLARSVYDRGWGPWLFVVALVIALAWVPVLIRFFRSWQARKNPISLAICILVTLAVYLPAYATLAVPPSLALVTFLNIHRYFF